MIDTVAIYTRDFSHKGNYPDGFQILQQTDINTGAIISKKIVFNSDKLNLTETDDNLLIHFSMPKLYGLPTNFYPLGKDSFQVVIDTLQTFLKKFGYELDFKTFKIGRLDIFKNVLLNYDFINYLSIFSYLNFKRTHKRDYVDGFLYANKQKELCFYNKTKELLEKVGFIPDGLPMNRVMRGELRLLNHKQVEKYGIDDFLSIPDKWDDIKGVYKSQLQEVFNANFKDEDEIINAKILIIREKGIDEAMKIFAYHSLSDIPRDTLRDVLANQMYERKVYRLLNKVDKIKTLYGSLQRSKELFEEIKEKFLS